MQESGSNEEIKAFVSTYDVKFQMMDKIKVNGHHALSLFKYLKHSLKGSFGSFIKWNFSKFLCDRKGAPFKRFGPKDDPFSIEDDIRALLAKSA